MASKPNPLPLNSTLQDLALLRACDVDFSSTLTDAGVNASASTRLDENKEAVVHQSYEFVREARAALKIHRREYTSKQGGRVEEIRSVLEDVTQGLESA